MDLGYPSRIPPVYLGGGTRRPAANLTSARVGGRPAPGRGAGAAVSRPPAPGSTGGRRQVHRRSLAGHREVHGPACRFLRCPASKTPPEIRFVKVGGFCLLAGLVGEPERKCKRLNPCHLV